MVVAGIVGTTFTIAGVLLALVSLWMLIKASTSNLADRTAEVEARERVARGEGWSDDTGRVPFTDDELRALGDAQAAQGLEDAGVVARPRDDDPRGRRRRSDGR